jgi:hypothetical protein
MSLLEQLNYKCDDLTKSADSRRIINCPETVSTTHQSLPLESAALFHNGVKISGKVAERCDLNWQGGGMGILHHTTWLVCYC